MLTAVIQKCPNLQNLEVGDQHVTKSTFRNMKIIVKKLKTLRCFLIRETKQVYEQDLIDLLIEGNKLEHFSIWTRNFDGTFLNFLPRDTLKELILQLAPCIPLEKIEQVRKNMISKVYTIH